MDTTALIITLLGVLTTLLGGVVGAVVAVVKLRPDIEGVEAVADRDRATAEQNRAEASKIFTEAAATLVVPLQSEVMSLRERVARLEAALELERIQHQETRRAQEERDAILLIELARRGINVPDILRQRRREGWDG